MQVSEEDDEPTIIKEAQRGDYCVVFDPLVRHALSASSSKFGKGRTAIAW